MGRNLRAPIGVAAHPATRGESGSQAELGPILHVLASSHGGGAVHVRTLTAGLARRGVQTVVALPFDGGHVTADDFTHAGVAVEAWTTDEALRSIVALGAILRRCSPQLIHTHGSRAATLTWAALRTTRLKRPRIHSAHGFVTPFHAQPRRFIQLMMERLVGRASHQVLAGSQHERAALIAARIGAANRVVAIPQGVDVARLAALTSTDRVRSQRDLGLDGESFVVLSVCRLDRPRDFPTLLRAFALLLASHAESTLVIVGDGAERARVTELAHELGIAEHVRLAGLQRDPSPYYGAADAFVSTSYGWEALGIATIEAQAAGLPVIVTDAGGAAEAFLPGITGVLVPMRAPKQLATALLQLAKAPRLRRDMGDAGRAHALSHFAIDPMIDAVLRAYESALA